MKKDKKKRELNSPEKFPCSIEQLYINISCSKSQM